MAYPSDESLSLEFRTKRAEAEARLLLLMEQHGLHRQAGWEIIETTRETEGGTEVVLRPRHRFLPAPPALECSVSISEGTARVEWRCA